MRTLTSKQKKLLDKTLELFDETKGEGRNEIQSANDLPSSIWEELERINNTEILFQEVSRYISDWHWEKIDRKERLEKLNHAPLK